MTGTAAQPIRTLLIANRGEIACRVARSCRRLGIRSVAVATESDRESLHARSADLTVPLSSECAPDGYRDVAGLVAAARQVGADAVHPGYGFLAENAAFAQACLEAGCLFVGPPPAAIAAMGDKSAAKGLAREAGVPVLPGVEEQQGAASEDPDAALIEAAAELGYPLLVKAAAGGGGKGLRRVDDCVALPDALVQVRREAQTSFGSDRLLLERYVTRPRHVEVQVLADAHGRVLHLHDRDCSLQRRHQKLIEEAPAPGLSAAARDALHRAAVQLARAIDYRNAGTVEFILDAATEEVFFLEMNTRLQVEHPVTEAVFGLDLVEWQLRIAMGQPLPFEQAELTPVGCAVEARVNAEDPTRDFAPAAGRIALFEVPAGIDLRVDGGVASGDAVTPDYDSLVAKLIAHGPDRAAAMLKLAAGLRETHVFGLPTTAPFLAEILSDPSFYGAPATTNYLAERWPDGWPGPDAADAARPECLLQAAVCVCCRGATEPGPEAASPWSRLRFWRVSGEAPVPARTLVVLRDAAGRKHRFWARPGEGSTGRVALQRFDDADDTWTRLGSSWAPQQGEGGWLTMHEGRAAPRRYRVLLQDRTIHLDDGAGWTAFEWLEAELAELAEGPGDGTGDGRLTAPMPGRVQSLEVAVGDRVAAGDQLLVMESMKMFHTVVAPAAGVVRALPVGAGDPVTTGQRLAEIEPEAEGGASGAAGKSASDAG